MADIDGVAFNKAIDQCLNRYGATHTRAWMENVLEDAIRQAEGGRRPLTGMASDLLSSYEHFNRKGKSE